MELKRYQIFLSSTFADLEVERRKVMQTLLELDCIPSGMEFFPATDEETFEFIKTIIDTSDYYVLIVSARYGSIDGDGLSYTEKEYDYAESLGKPILSFVRKDISDVAVRLTDQNPDLAIRLDQFRQKISNGRLVRFWDNSDQLAGQVATTLTSAIKRYPALGWTRGGQAASSEILAEINQLRKENEGLKKKVQEASPAVSIENLASLESQYTFPIRFMRNSASPRAKLDFTMTWGDVLKIIGSRYRTASNSSSIDSLQNYLEVKMNFYDVSIDTDTRNQILTQFELLGIMKAEVYNLQNGGKAIFHRLTGVGVQEYLKRMAITEVAS